MLLNECKKFFAVMCVCAAAYFGFEGELSIFRVAHTLHADNAFDVSDDVALNIQQGYEDALPVYMSLKTNNVNVRKGPGKKYPISWIYQRKNMPVKILKRFDNWYNITDFEGDAGWIHSSMLSKKRGFILIHNKIRERGGLIIELNPEELLVYRHPSDSSYPSFRIKKYVVGQLHRCKGEWCQVKVARHKGWVRKENIWGVD